MQIRTFMVAAVLSAAGAAPLAHASDLRSQQAEQGGQALARESLDSFFRSYFSAVEAGDPEGILALIDADFVIAWPGGEPVTDRDRLRTALAALQSRVRQDIAWEVLEAHVEGDWAWARVLEAATHHPKTGGAPRVFRGTHLAILRKADGRWRLHRDYAALHQPPPPSDIPSSAR